jgi:hypothetical protein
MTPEQIYQPRLNWEQVIGTWEILPDDNPLSENSKNKKKLSIRTLMTLRKDGTCRIFNKDYPDGSDGLWTFDNHKMFISFADASRIDYYVYGVKADFMMTRTPIKGGRDQLWSRVR